MTEEIKDRVACVTADDRFLRWEDRRVIHRDRLVHRSIHVLLFDAAGRLVLQKRHRQKLTWPGHWDVSASGHVEERDYPDPSRPDDDLDALYEAVAHRELEEELGVRAPLVRLGRFAPVPGVHYERIHLFRGSSDGPYRAQPEEVEEVRAVSRAALLREMAAGGPLTSPSTSTFTSTLRWFVDWAVANGHWS